MSEPVTLNLGAPHVRPAAHGSTGPRSEAGKQRSSRNSLKHGLAASDVHVTEDEREEFDEFKSALLKDLQPRGATQMLFFNNLLLASWSLLRISRMEAAYLNQGPEALEDPEIRKALELLHRYQARHERSLYRARKELEQLQTAEIVRQLLPEEVQNATPPLANPMKIHSAKRTADAAWIDGLQEWAIPVRPDSQTGQPVPNGFKTAPEANIRR
jgi:hypothetical protein